MTGYERISRERFYRMGAFSNGRLVRTERNGAWAYFLNWDN